MSVMLLENVCRKDVNLVGGKAANLGELTSHGFQVPQGFVVTVKGYETFIHQTKANHKIRDFLQDFNGTPQEYEDLSARIRCHLEEQPMPSEIRDKVVNCYQEMCNKRGGRDVEVAVRSSGIAEDLDGASSAGQYDTYLNVKGIDEVLKNIVKCWASSFTSRSMVYRKKNDFSLASNPMGVVVQEMVKARSAGVAFTIEPVTGSDTTMLIEGTWGLGEAVVSGLVTPDSFMVDKCTLEIQEKVAEKTIKLIPVENGIREIEVPPEDRNTPCLSKNQIRKLAELCLGIERQYGKPQDIEWVVDGDGNIILVQTRAVTTVVKSATECAIDYMISALW